MVFHYMNFVIETNVWWLKRIWWTATAMGVYYLIYRYYFYGKLQAQIMDRRSPDDWEELAKLNKRNYGFGNYYRPTLERSMKKKLYAELGDNYIYAEPWTTRYMVDTRPLEEVYLEENDYFKL